MQQSIIIQQFKKITKRIKSHVYKKKFQFFKIFNVLHIIFNFIIYRTYTYTNYNHSFINDHEFMIGILPSSPKYYRYTYHANAVMHKKIHIFS